MTRWVGRSDDLIQCLEIRRAVFIEEQGVSVEDEVDGQDSKALHFLLRDNTVPVGTARILILDEIGKIGRVCVLAPYRGRGHAKALRCDGPRHGAPPQQAHRFGACRLP